MNTDDRTKLATPLRDWLQRLNKAEQAVQEAMRPYRDAIDEIDGAREAIEEFMAGEGVILGKCMDCSAPVIEGDKGYRYASGETCCANCSPTYEEVQKQADEILAKPGDYDAETVEGAKQRLVMIADHLAGGGALLDRQTWEL